MYILCVKWKRPDFEKTKLWPRSLDSNTIFTPECSQATSRYQAGIWEREIEMARTGFEAIYDDDPYKPHDNLTTGQQLLGYGPALRKQRQAGKILENFSSQHFMGDCLQKPFKIVSTSIAP